MRFLLALVWLMACAQSAAGNSVASGWLSKPSQPRSLASPDGAWKLEIEPLSRDWLGASDVLFRHGGQETFKAHWWNTPFLIAVSNAGTIALEVENDSSRTIVRLLAPSGDVVIEREFNEESAPRYSSFHSIFADAGMHAFVVVIERRGAMAPTTTYGGVTLAALDERTGEPRVPATDITIPAEFGPYYLVHRVVPVHGTHWTVAEVHAFKPRATHVLILDERFAIACELPTEGIASNDMFDSPCLLDSARPGEIEVRWPNATERVRYAVHAEDGLIKPVEVAREADEPTPLTPRVRLALRAEIPLDLPATFVASRAAGERQIPCFLGLDERGRILVQDVGTMKVHVLDERGHALVALSLDELNPLDHKWINSASTTEDGGFDLRSGYDRRVFAPDGKHLLDERAAYGIVYVDDGCWCEHGDGLQLRHYGAERDFDLERHGDRRFFTEISGWKRDGDRLIVLDTMDWIRRQSVWSGRLAQFGLDGHPIEHCTLTIAPGARRTHLIASARPWALLADLWAESPNDAAYKVWLARTDDGSVRLLEWHEKGRMLGFAAGGKELWRVDLDARKLCRYALP